MADLSKIKLNGTVYNFKDAHARFIDIPLTLTYDDSTEEYNLTYTGTNINDVEKENARLIVSCPDTTTKIFYRMTKNLDNFSSLDANDSLGLSTIVYNGDTFNLSYVDVMSLADIDFVSHAITEALGDITGFNIQVVQSLPATGEQGTFYFVDNSGSGNNIYDEYVYVNNSWEKIGTTEVDLSNYLQNSDIADWAKAATKPAYTANEVGAVSNTAPAATITAQNISNWNAKSDFSGSYTDLTNKPMNVSDFTNDAGYLTSYTETDPTVPSWAKASTKPSYTASEVGAAAASHDHGKLKSDGRITTSVDIQSGDKLVFIDSNQNSVINGSSITFGSSTTQFLANNGTWKSVSVVQTLTSGTAIGSVQGTTLYAPNPYNDTALTNRVSALESKDTTLENRIAAIENLEWARYYSGQSNPTSSLGENGDIYLQY